MSKAEEINQNRERYKRLKAKYAELQALKAELVAKFGKLQTSGKFKEVEEMTPELASALERAKENAAQYSQEQFKAQESKPTSRPGIRSRRGMIRL